MCVTFASGLYRCWLPRQYKTWHENHRHTTYVQPQMFWPPLGWDRTQRLHTHTSSHISPHLPSCKTNDNQTHIRRATHNPPHRSNPQRVQPLKEAEIVNMFPMMFVVYIYFTYVFRMGLGERWVRCVDIGQCESSVSWKHDDGSKCELSTCFEMETSYENSFHLYICKYSILKNIQANHFSHFSSLRFICEGLV